MSVLPGRFVLRGGGAGFPRIARGGRSRAPIRPGVRGEAVGRPALGRPALGGGERVRRGEGGASGGRFGTIVNGAVAGGAVRNALREAVSGGSRVVSGGSRVVVSRVELGKAEAAGVVLLLYADAVVNAADGALVNVLVVRFSEAGACRGGFATWWPRSVNVGGVLTESFGCSESTSLNRKRKSRPYSWSNCRTMRTDR